MIEPSGWHCHPVATEKRFTQMNFNFLILTQNERKVRKINASLDLDVRSLTGNYTTDSSS